jgi:FeS assembly protein IscX
MMDDTLSWEDTYSIAQELIRRHPEAQVENVSLGMIYRWTTELPNFYDDKELANDSILSAIYQEWLEEILTNE